MLKIRIPLEYAYIFPKGEKPKMCICEKCDMVFIKGGCMCSEKKEYEETWKKPRASMSKTNETKCNENQS